MGVAPGRFALLCLALGVVLGARVDARPAPGSADRLTFIEQVTAGAAPDAKLPMIIAVHGLGDRPERFARLMASFPVPARVIVPRGPTPHGRGYSWFPVRIPVVDDDPAMVTGLTDSARRLAELARHLSQTRPTVGRPIITGFSQGGMASFAVALHHPDAIRAAVPIAGALPTALWRGRGGPPIIAIHGDADRVVPYRRGRSLVDALAARGLPARLITLPGVAHRIPPKARSAVYDALAESLPSPGP